MDLLIPLTLNLSTHIWFQRQPSSDEVQVGFSEQQATRNQTHCYEACGYTFEGFRFFSPLALIGIEQPTDDVIDKGNR